MNEAYHLFDPKIPQVYCLHLQLRTETHQNEIILIIETERQSFATPYEEA